MDVAVLVAVVVGSMANLLATVGFALQPAARTDRVLDRLTEHVLDNDRHTVT